MSEGQSLENWLAAARANTTHQMAALQTQLETLKTNADKAKVGKDLMFGC